MALTLFCPTHSLRIFSRSVRVVTNGRVSSCLISSFLVEMHHIFFIWSSIKGHCRCFRVLATMSNTAVNIWVHRSLWYTFSNFSSRRPEEGLLDHMVALFLFFEETSYCFPQWLYQLTLPPAVNGGPFFSTTSLKLVITCFLDNSHSNRCEVVSHFSFDLYFPNSWWNWESYHVSFGHLYIFLKEVSVEVLCPFFNWIVWCLLYEFLIYFGY